LKKFAYNTDVIIHSSIDDGNESRVL